MGGFFGVASKNDCSLDLFFGVDYHSHLGTRRGGIAILDKAGKFLRSILSQTHREIPILQNKVRKGYRRNARKSWYRLYQ